MLLPKMCSDYISWLAAVFRDSEPVLRILFDMLEKLVVRMPYLSIVCTATLSAIWGKP